jgi:5'-nucleotidase
MALHVLLSNDDGILAPGLVAFHEALVRAGHRVTIAAPSGERSASSHAISIWKNLETRFIKRDGVPWGWSIDATPADCVKLALSALLTDDPPDAMVSGVNPGPNIGDAIFYSGTVAAAAEATLYGVPAVAVSLCSHYGQERHFETAANFGVRMAEKIAGGKLLPPRTLLNVNVPNLPESELRGVAATLQGQSAYIDQMKLHRPADGLHLPALWRNEGSTMRLSPGEGQWDDWAIEQGRISVTPLRLDLCCPELMAATSDWLEEMAPDLARRVSMAESAPSVETWSPFPVHEAAPRWDDNSMDGSGPSDPAQPEEESLDPEKE